MHVIDGRCVYEHALLLHVQMINSDTVKRTRGISSELFTIGTSSALLHFHTSRDLPNATVQWLSARASYIFPAMVPIRRMRAKMISGQN